MKFQLLKDYLLSDYRSVAAFARSRGLPYQGALQDLFNMMIDLRHKSGPGPAAHLKHHWNSVTDLMHGIHGEAWLRAIEAYENPPIPGPTEEEKAAVVVREIMKDWRPCAKCGYDILPPATPLCVMCRTIAREDARKDKGCRVGRTYPAPEGSITVRSVISVIKQSYERR